MDSSEDVRYSWDAPLRAIPTAEPAKGGGLLRDLLSWSWRANEGTHRTVLDLANAMHSMRMHVNQDLRESLRARATGIKSLEVMEDTNVFLVFLKSSINDDDKAVVKVRLLSSPEWPFSPAYVEAAMQLALHTLTPFCPHFAQMSFTLRGGGVALPGWPMHKVVPTAQWSLNDMDIDLDGGGSEMGRQSDLGDDVPVLFVIEEFLDASVDSWFREALDCLNMNPRHPNLPGALMNAACCLFQIVFALFTAQRWFSFQHNDLHHANIRLKLQDGAASCETWKYSVPVNRSGAPPLSFSLPGHVVRGRRVKIFDFGLSTLRGVRSVGSAGLPTKVDCFQPTIYSPAQRDRPLPREGELPIGSETPPSHELKAPFAEDDADVDVPNPDVVIDDGVGLFPLSAEDIRWFSKTNITVPATTLSRAESAIRAQSLLPLPLPCDSDDARRIPHLPMGREVPGYDLAVWVRHMLYHERGFCGLVSAVKAMAEREERQDPHIAWAREFIEWVCQAAGLEWRALRFVDGVWGQKGGGTVNGPRFLIPQSTALVQFLRPSQEEQASAPLDDPAAMQSLLEHAFLRRWLDPPPQTCVFQDPNPATHLTAQLTSIPEPTREELAEIQNRLHRSRPPSPFSK